MKLKTCLCLVVSVVSLFAQADFRYCSEMTVSGYSGESVLSGFPVLVRLSPARVSGFDYALCRADGRDIRFVSPDGQTVYPHEIETWNPDGESLVWVRLPSVSGQDTKFRFLFGDPSAAPASSSSVWRVDDASGYRGVWHFAERTADGRAVAADSAKADPEHVMDAIPHGGQILDVNYVLEMTSTDGVVGLGRFNHQENPTYSSWFEVPGFTGSDTTASGRFTVSGWFSGIKRNGNASLIGQSADQWEGDSSWQVFWYNDDTNLKCATTSASFWTKIPNLKDGWTHLTVVYDDTTVSVYTNGVLANVATVTGAAGDNGKTLTIGARTNGNGAMPFYGAFDELRLYAGVPSADRVKAAYASMAEDFVTAGPVRLNGMDRLYVTGDPACASGGLPRYGVTENLTDGEVVECRAPTGAFSYADGLEAQVTGWTLYDVAADGTETLVGADTGASFDYTHVAGTTRRLVWSFALMPKFIYEAELTVSGYAGSSALRGFPLLVRLSPTTVSGFAYNLCQTHGEDIQFLSPDGKTVYPHEIERWDATGESLVWVRLPELVGAETTVLFRFGCANLTPTAAAKDTWASSAGGYYAGVWHFGETIGSDQAATAVSADSAKHSPSLDLDGIPTNTQKLVANMRQMTSAAGKIGLARVNSVDKENNYLSIPSYDAFSLGSNFTFTGWFRVTDLKDGSYARLFGRSFTQWSGDGAWCGQYYGGGARFKIYQGAENGDIFTVPDVTAQDWAHYAVVFDGYAMKLYLNGVLWGSQVKAKAPADNGKPLALGSSMGAWRFYGLYDEVRVLSTAATPDWIRAEYDTANDAGFVSYGAAHLLSDDSFFITSSTESVGAVTPAYGTYEGALFDGARIACSADGTVMDLTPEVKAQIVGWKLYEYGEDGMKPSEPYDSAGTNQLVYVHAAGKTRELEWQVVRLRPLVLSATRAATFLVNGEPGASGTNWVAEGTVVLKVTASSGTEGGDWVFNGWKVNGAFIGTEDEVEIVLTGPVEITADYTSLLHVATDGDDAYPGTEAQPLKTLTAAFATAHPTDEIRVRGGLYDENVTATGVRSVTVRGGYDGNWARDLRDAPTIVKAAAKGQPVLRLEEACSNVFSGLVLTGGSRGLFAYGTYGNRFEQMVVTNNTDVGVRLEGKSGVSQADASTFACCLIACNGSRGLEQKSNDWDNRSGCRLLNCTIVSNKSDGVFFHLREIDIVNCVIAGNGGFGWNADALRNTGCGDIASSCIFGNASGGIALYKTAVNPYVHIGAGLFRLDPQVGAGGVPADGSPVRGQGADLSDGDCAVTEDLYGTPWNGAYDLGCVKVPGAAAPVALQSDVYVAPTGDDAAAGDAAHPVRTINRGLYLTAANGTCHVAAGTYAETVQVNRPGVTLKGEGRAVTFLDGTASAGENAVVLAADDAVLEGFDIAGARCGVYLPSHETAADTVVRDCAIHGNFRGIIKQWECLTPVRTGCRTTLSHLEVFGNDDAGIVFSEDNYDRKMVIDNTLIASNGWNSTLAAGENAERHNVGFLALRATADLYYVTVVSNQGAGVSAAAAWGNHLQLVSRNGIFARNGFGWWITNGGRSEDGTVNLFDNDTDFTGTLTYLQNFTNSFLFAPAGLRYDERHYARPQPGSPALRSGERLASPWDTVADLDGQARTRRRPDLGCYTVKAGLTVIVR